MKKISCLVISLIAFLGCKNDGYVWGNTEFEFNGVKNNTNDYTFNRHPIDNNKISRLRPKDNVNNSFPLFMNLDYIEGVRFTLHKQDELMQKPFISNIEWGQRDVATCGYYELFESDSANNWIIFDCVGKNKRHIRGRFSGTYVFVKNGCKSDRPINTDTVRIRNGSFNLRD
jgi:hypothetical protein